MQHYDQFVRKASSIPNLTTATLQEYLFVNRTRANIMEKFDQLSRMLNERNNLLHPRTEASNSYI